MSSAIPELGGGGGGGQERVSNKSLWVRVTPSKNHSEWVVSTKYKPGAGRWHPSISASETQAL